MNTWHDFLGLVNSVVGTRAGVAPAGEVLRQGKAATACMVEARLRADGLASHEEATSLRRRRKSSAGRPWLARPAGAQWAQAGLPSPAGRHRRKEWNRVPPATLISGISSARPRSGRRRPSAIQSCSSSGDRAPGGLVAVLRGLIEKVRPAKTTVAAGWRPSAPTKRASPRGRGLNVHHPSRLWPRLRRAEAAPFERRPRRLIADPLKGVSQKV